MKAGLHPAYVLHYRPYRETSMLLDVFSRDHGRVGLVAKGAKQKRNNISLLLQPYQKLLMSWSGRGELMTLNQVELDRPASIPEEDRLISAFYINELIIRLLHQHEAHPELFMVYDATLGDLAIKEKEQQAIIRIFEKRLLQSLGYGLVLDHDVETGIPVDDSRDYYYQAERGPVTNIPSDMDFVRVSGTTLNALAHESLTDRNALDESKKLMRYILQKHLGQKPLASRSLYASYVGISKSRIAQAR